eukprot:378848-Rhodomonas_salina.3
MAAPATAAPSTTERRETSALMVTAARDCQRNTQHKSLHLLPCSTGQSKHPRATNRVRDSENLVIFLRVCEKELLAQRQGQNSTWVVLRGRAGPAEKAEAVAASAARTNPRVNMVRQGSEGRSARACVCMVWWKLVSFLEKKRQYAKICTVEYVKYAKKFVVTF